MANVLQMVKNAMTKSDNIDALVAEIENAKDAGIRAYAELERLEAARLVAEDYETARGIDEQLARVRWGIDRIDAMLPALENRLKIARNTRQQEAIAKHVAINRRAWPKFRAALSAAVDAQAAVIADRDAAVAEIGEHAASIHLPFLAFRGFLYRDLFDIYAAELDRVYAEPAVKSAVVASRIASVQARPVHAGTPRIVRLDEPVHAPPPRKKTRPLHKVKVAVGDRRLCVFLRANVELDGGDLSLVGDQIDLPTEQAKALCQNGAVELVSAAVAVAVASDAAAPAVSKGETTP
jgi:hypothetical protein